MRFLVVNAGSSSLKVDLVEAGEVGERAAPMRRRATAHRAYLGVHVDEPRNAAAEPDTDVSTHDSSVRTLVVGSREDLEIAAGAQQVLAGAARS